MSILVSSKSQAVSDSALDEPKNKELNAASYSSLAFDEIEMMIRALNDRGVNMNLEVRGYITKAQVLAELGQKARLTEFCDQVLQKFDVSKKIAALVSICTPASAYWNQRMVLASSRQRIKEMSETVNDQNGLTLSQWAQFTAMTLEFKPDLIIELGEGEGSSTCLFTESANLLGGRSATQVANVCNSTNFVTEGIPRLFKKGLINRNWLEPLDYWHTNILTFDYEKLLEGKKRVVLFWDAHGFEVAGCVLGKILPLLQNKNHIVLMNGISDKRYIKNEELQYNGQKLWRDTTAKGPRLVLGNIISAQAQAVSITDFSSRNGIEILSADHSYYSEIKPYSKHVDEMRHLLGNELFSLQGNWSYFSLNEYPSPITFPRFIAPEAQFTDDMKGLVPLMPGTMYE